MIEIYFDGSIDPNFEGNDNTDKQGKVEGFRFEIAFAEQHKDEYEKLVKSKDTFIETYRKIVSEFFPSSDRYEYAGGVEIEVYPSDKTDDPNYSGEIWIAVNEK